MDGTSTALFRGSANLHKTGIHKAVAGKIKSSLYQHGSPMLFFEEKRKSREQKLTSNRIDQELNKRKKDERSRYTVILFGTEQSGKSTIIKQLRILYGDGFSDEEKMEIANNIKQNVKEAVLNILTAMSKLSPSITLEKAENQERVDYIHNCISKPNFDYPLEFFEHIEVLWKDEGVKAAVSRGNEYNLSDCAKYFLDRVNIIKKPTYVPTQEDILYCHTIHDRGVFDTSFKHDITLVGKGKSNGKTKTINFYLTEIFKQNEKRRLWSYFDNAALLFYVSACHSYDIPSHSDPAENQLEESMRLFKDVCKCQWTWELQYVLIFNKKDLLTEKILAGRNKLEDYFPDFKYFRTFNDLSFGTNDDPKEVVRAKCFILEKFLKIHTGTSEQWYPNRPIYFHFTCAKNTQNVEKAFNSCNAAISRHYMYACNLLL